MKKIVVEIVNGLFYYVYICIGVLKLVLIGDFFRVGFIVKYLYKYNIYVFCGLCILIICSIC